VKWIKNAVLVCICAALLGVLALLVSHPLPKEWAEAALLIAFCIIVAVGMVASLYLPASSRRSRIPLAEALFTLLFALRFALDIRTDIGIGSWSASDWWPVGFAALALFCTGVFLGMTLEACREQKAGARDVRPPVESNGAQA